MKMDNFVKIIFINICSYVLCDYIFLNVHNIILNSNIPNNNKYVILMHIHCFVKQFPVSSILGAVQLVWIIEVLLYYDQYSVTT